MNDTNPVSEAVQPISTDQKVGGSSPSKRAKTGFFSREPVLFFGAVR